MICEALIREPLIEVLPGTRSCQHRAIRYWPGEPGTGRLEVTDRKRTIFAVTEFEADDGRAFRLVKTGRLKPDEELQNNVLIAADGLHSCDCMGFLSEATERADRRAGEAGESLGCRHLDGIYYGLILNGWI